MVWALIVLIAEAQTHAKIILYSKNQDDVAPFLKKIAKLTHVVVHL